MQLNFSTKFKQYNLMQSETTLYNGFGEFDICKKNFQQTLIKIMLKTLFA